MKKNLAMAGRGGASLARDAPMAKTFLSHFHAFLENLVKLYVGVPPARGSAPLLRRIQDLLLIRVDSVISGEGWC